MWYLKKNPTRSCRSKEHFFKYLMGKGKMTEKEHKGFTNAYKQNTYLGKMHLVPQIHRSLYYLQTVASLNCSTPEEKISEFLDSHFKPILFGVIKVP